MHSLKLGDDGSTVEMRVGEILTVRLPENDTTGYRWAADGVDQGVLELLPDDPGYGDPAIGAGGDVTFRARAVAPGETSFGLVQLRPWEGRASAIRSFRVSVSVREEG